MGGKYDRFAVAGFCSFYTGGDRSDRHREHRIAIGSLQRTLHLHLLLFAHGATVVPAYAGPVDHRTRRIVTLVVGDASRMNVSPSLRQQFVLAVITRGAGPRNLFILRLGSPGR